MVYRGKNEPNYIPMAKFYSRCIAIGASNFLSGIQWESQPSISGGDKFMVEILEKQCLNVVSIIP
jgi:hypothetical protein